MSAHGRPATPTPDRRVRAFGLVLLVLALLSLLGAFTGLDTTGVGPRVTLGVLGGLMLVVGALLLAARTPALGAVDLDARGLVVTVTGQPVDVVPWASLTSFGLRRVGPNERGERMGLRPGGLIVGVGVRSADVPARLRAFTVGRSGDVTDLMFGLTRAQALQLRRRLPGFTDQLAALHR